MHNPITYAISNLKMIIPKEILEKTFISLVDHRWRSANTLDLAIREQVLEEKVLVDCNLLGGTETYVSLDGLPYDRVDQWTTVYRIPKELTQGRSITRALSLSYGNGTLVASGSSMVNRNSSTLLDAANSVVQSQSPIPLVSTAYVQLVGDNVVMIQDSVMLPGNVSLRCRLENDTNFNHLQTTSYPQFAKLTELATKAFIYTRNQIPMDRSYLNGGSDLGAYKNVIDTYSDAAEMYQDYFRKVWTKVSILNDYTGHSRHLKLITGGGW